MPALDEHFFKINFQNDENIFKEYPIFIESGTYYGETTYNMTKLFEEIYTIEIKKEIFNSTYNKLKNIVNNVNFILGDSSIILNTLCKEINRNTIFFLDGHWSAGNTGRGTKDCPLIEELLLIINNFKQKAIIIIDDCRLFGQGPNTTGEICNWEDISNEQILNIVKHRCDKYYYVSSNLHIKDRLIIYINKL